MFVGPGRAHVTPTWTIEVAIHCHGRNPWRGRELLPHHSIVSTSVLDNQTQILDHDICTLRGTNSCSKFTNTNTNNCEHEEGSETEER